MIKQLLISVLLFVSGVLLPGCSKKAPVPEDIIPMTDISYGKHSRQIMDIFLPENIADGEKAPIVLSQIKH